MNKFIFSLIFFLAPIVHAENNYIGCSQDQIADFKVSLYYARDMLDTAISSTSDNDLFERWFGTTPVHIIKEKLSKLYAPFDNLTISCNCKVNAYAFAQVEHSYYIDICNLYWNADFVGYNSKAGTFFHELTHFESTIRTYDISRYYEPMKLLARIQPDAALRNSTSYEYLVEEIYRRKTN